MSRHKYLIVVMLVALEQAHSKLLTDTRTKAKDQCKEICNENFFLLPPRVSDSNAICERGCRLFNIIDAEGTNNVLNKTKVACHASCNEAYISPNFDACITGCNEMEKKRMSDFSGSFFVYIEQEGGNNLMVVQPELEQFDLDLFADPVLRNQLGYSLEYKIPETHIRTMPINSGVDGYDVPPELSIKSYEASGDWLDCASRNSGIPRWILVSAILMAALIGVWLIFATDKRDPVAPPDYPDLLPNDIEYTAPPKYSLESEKV